MQRFKRILVYISPEHDASVAIRRAADLAHRNRAKLLFLGVVPEPPWYAKLMVQRSLQPPELRAKELEGWLADIATPLRAGGLEVETRVAVGAPFLALIRTAIGEGFDLIIKTAEGGSRLRSALFGSTAMHLMRKSECPVWIVEPNESDAYRRILVAVDPDPQRDASRELTRKLLELSSSMSERHEAELHVLHVWRVPFESTLRRHGSAADVAEAISKTRSRAEKAVWNAIESFREYLPVERIHIRRGEPEWLINEMVEAIGADLLVMGTVGRTGVSGLLIGNVAERVMSDAQCSVLAVKPEGFVSPVRQGLTNETT